MRTHEHTSRKNGGSGVRVNRVKDGGQQQQQQLSFCASWWCCCCWFGYFCWILSRGVRARPTAVPTVNMAEEMLIQRFVNAELNKILVVLRTVRNLQLA